MRKLGTMLNSMPLSGVVHSSAGLVLCGSYDPTPFYRALFLNSMELQILECCTLSCSQLLFFLRALFDVELCLLVVLLASPRTLCVAVLPLSKLKVIEPPHQIGRRVVQIISPNRVKG
jgi:hypothetical protein